MDVFGLRQRVFVDLDHRPQQDKVDLWAQPGQVPQQVHIEPFVDHAVEADPRVRDCRLIGRVGLRLQRGGKVFRFDGTREREHIMVLRAFVLVQGPSAGKYDVGPCEELLFPP